jgi:hypothetical protein
MIMSEPQNGHLRGLAKPPIPGSARRSPRQSKQYETRTSPCTMAVQPRGFTSTFWTGWKVKGEDNAPAA